MYEVTLRRNSDNRIVKFNEDFEWEEGSDYWWSDGNMGCDCNRYLCFERALGNEPKDHVQCGENGYTILSISLPSGEIVYSEEPKAK